MIKSKENIINELQQDILSLQGFKSFSNAGDNIVLGPISENFPGKRFPVGQTHEFLIADNQSRAATLGFVNAISSSLLGKEKVGVWISSSTDVYPPALSNYAISPDQLLFIQTKNEKETLWVTEEALRCEGLAVVASEIRGFDFTASRRLQLAVEKSKVTGLLLRSSKYISTSASASRWQVKSVPSVINDIDLPGIHFPRWEVELLKVRNGKPGKWKIGWEQLQFQFEENSISELPLSRRKVI